MPTDADIGRGGMKGEAIGSDLEMTEEIKECVPHDPTLFASGCIVNAIAQTGDVSEKLLIATVEAFSTDLILVIDDDRLFNLLSKHCSKMGAKPPTVLKLAKSAGVVTP